jgi:hypothetical protein
MALLDETMLHMDIVSDEYVGSGRVITHSNGYKIHIDYDEFSESPREWDNLGKIYYWHRSYILGEKKIDTEYYDSFNDIIEMLNEEFGELIWLPVYLMDHSGISLSTSSTRFSMVDSAGWDWGMVGVIFATHDDIKNNFMVTELTDDILDKATECLIGEINDFDRYVSGDVYCYTITDANDEIVDSLCGIYGYENVESEAMNAAKWYWEKHIDESNVQLVLPLEIDNG